MLESIHKPLTSHALSKLIMPLHNKMVKLKAPVGKTSKTATFTQEKRLNSKDLEAKDKKRE